MEKVVEIIEAVRNLAPAEREKFFDKLRELAAEPEKALPGADPAAYASAEFTRDLTEGFHRAKRRALGAEGDAAAPVEGP